MKLHQALLKHRFTLSPYFLLTMIVTYLFGGLVTSFPLENHETPNLYFRIFEYVEEFKIVGFPPAIFPNSLYGGGFAFPIFYPPLGYYVGVGIAFFTNNYYFAGNLALFLSVLISGYTAFYGFSQLTRPAVALAASVIYVTMPYRFVDSIARGALAECWTFPWMPLIFCGGVLILRGSAKKGTILLSLATAAIVLSHAVMALYFISLCIVLFLLIAVISWRMAPLFYAIIAMGFAGSFAAWYIIPQQLLWDTVKAADPDFMWASIKSVSEHNVDFSQFFFTDPQRWLGGSNKGVIIDGMSFELGIGCFILLTTVILCPLWLTDEKNKLDRTETPLIWLTFSAWILSIVFLLKSEWFLDILPKQFLYIQFGWRTLGITCFLCAASMVIYCNRYLTKSNIDLAAVTAVILLCVLSVDHSHRQVKYDLEPLPVRIYASDSLKAGEKGFVELAEYLPATFLNHEKDRLQSKQPIHIGDMDIVKSEITTSTMTAQVVARTSSTLLLPLVAYPIYEARTQDGRILPRSQFNGLLTFEEIQPGDSLISIKRVLPREQRIGLITTLLGIIVFTLCLWLPIWNWGSGSSLPEKPRQKQIQKS